MTEKKLIATLSTDIYNVLDQKKEHEPNAALAAEYAMRIGGEFAKATMKRDKPREKGKLWASDLGKRCLRQHWYNFNSPEKGDPLLGFTKFKFLYGNILEEAVLYMAEEAGHDVQYAQKRIETELPRATGLDWTISGRIDGVIDGVLVDVKSTSSYGYTRYKDGINSTNDSFGYLQQIGFYANYGDWPKGDTPTDQGFVFIDKQNGHIKYVSSPIENKLQLYKRATSIADAIETENEPMVPRAFSPEPYGKSGNMVLPTTCSYCPFKRECWRDSNNGVGLRTFAYNHKPVSFTSIVREPKVPEIK